MIFKKSEILEFVKILPWKDNIVYGLGNQHTVSSEDFGNSQ